MSSAFSWHNSVSPYWGKNDMEVPLKIKTITTVKVKVAQSCPTL